MKSVPTAFEPGTPRRGVGTNFQCPKTGHQFAVIAPDAESLWEVLTLGLCIPASEISRDYFEAVAVSQANQENIP